MLRAHLVQEREELERVGDQRVDAYPGGRPGPVPCPRVVRSRPDAGHEAVPVERRALGFGSGQRLYLLGLAFADDAQLLAVGVIGERLDHVGTGMDEVAVQLRDRLGAVTAFGVTRIGIPSFIMTLAMLQIGNGICALLVRGQIAYNVPPLVGTLGSDATVFSFYANKTITTGEGGMVVTRDAALAQRIKVMRLHGISRDAFDRFTAKVPSWYYEIVAPGFKYNLTDIAAALGLQQLKKARRFAEQRAGELRLPRGAIHVLRRAAAQDGAAIAPGLGPVQRGGMPAVEVEGPDPHLGPWLVGIDEADLPVIAPVQSEQPFPAVAEGEAAVAQ